MRCFSNLSVKYIPVWLVCGLTWSCSSSDSQSTPADETRSSAMPADMQSPPDVQRDIDLCEVSVHLGQLNHVSVPRVQRSSGRWRLPRQTAAHAQSPLSKQRPVSVPPLWNAPLTCLETGR